MNQLEKKSFAIVGRIGQSAWMELERPAALIVY